MVDRVALIQAVAKNAKFSPADGKKFNDQLTKALTLATASASLEDVRRLPQSTRSELAVAMNGVLGSADLKAVAKKWEPKRKADAAETQTEAASRLIELIDSRRDPYVPMSISLKDARRLDLNSKNGMVDSLKRVAPTADIKRIAKKWDGHNAALLEASRAEILRGILSLLEGSAEPIPKPKK